jgi:cytochrome P450
MQELEAWGDYNLDNPFPLFHEVLTQGAVHAVTLTDGHDAYLVMRYDEVKTALNDPRLSKDMQAALALGGDVVAEGLPGPEFARHMLVVDPPDHTRLRRLVAAAFSVRRIEALAPRVQTIVDDLLDDIAGQGPDAVIDLVSSFAFPLPFTVICELLGVPMSERESFREGLSVLLSPTPTQESSDCVVALLRALVDARQRDPDDGLVSALISARDGDERLNQRELLSTIFQLIVAGHDTTASLIGNSVVALLRNPEQMARLRADESLMPHAVEELLRYDAPVPHATFRYATESIELGGVTIPPGAQVIINLAAANRDPEHYADPDRLDLDRADVRHLGFGHGIHFCLGAPLARMEGQLALRSLLTRFPEMRLAVADGELHWGHGDGLVLRGLSELPVVMGTPASS